MQNRGRCRWRITEHNPWRSALARSSPLVHAMNGHVFGPQACANAQQSPLAFR
jgi:hypothetical protein